MRKIERILCPTDFSEASRHAVEHAVVIARWYGASIAALHVYNLTFPPLAMPMVVTTPYELIPEQDQIARLREEAKAFFRAAIDAGVTVDVFITEGPPAVRIVEHAKALAADMIVLGTHGHSGFEHLILGSVTEKVVRKADCPVLTVPPRARATSSLPFKRILCPVDFSDASLAALDTACSLAKQGDASLTLLYVLEEVREEEPRANRPFSVPEYRQQREADAVVHLNMLLAQPERKPTQAATRLGYGKPYRQILSAASEEDSDLIVMGVHGRHALDLMLFGSTTNQVVRRATCPVLTVRR